MTNEHRTNKTPEPAETTQGPELVSPTNAELHAQLAKIREQTQDAMIYANTLAQSELHDKNELLDLRTIALTNRRLIRELQTELAIHAQTIMQQREALDELATTYNTRRPARADALAACRNLGDDPLDPATQSNDDNVGTKERGDG